jgi:hypothetical protein
VQVHMMTSKIVYSIKHFIIIVFVIVYQSTILSFPYLIKWIIHKFELLFKPMSANDQLWYQ